jgi:predicted permease
VSTTPGQSVIAAAARLVPSARRAAWQREWEGETTYAWRVLHQQGSSPWQRLRLRVRILMCFIDALWERKQTMTFSGIVNDLRFALRGLARYPTFSAVAALTLALGIAATTAVFTLVDGVLIRPLPYRDADRLVSLEHLGREGRDELPMSQGLYITYGEHARSLEGLALYGGTSVNIVNEGDAQRMRADVVTPSFFRVLGVDAALGRTFEEPEGAPDGELAVILSDGYWRTAFGADPDVIGRDLDVNGRLRPIVGVMPPDFGFPNTDARLWVPMVVDPARAPLAAFGAGGIGLMAPGATVETVHAELEGLIGRLAELYPDSGGPAFLAEVGLRARVMPLKENLVGNISSTLWVLMGTVGLVLVIACANVANLLLVRADARRRELAVRVAMGAGRMQVLRWFLSESVVLALVGGIAGVVIAVIAVRTSTSFVPTDVPRMAEVGVDVRVLAFSAAVALGCALFFGSFPVLRARTDNPASQLREGAARGGTSGRERNRLRSSLVVTQMALALVLLVGSGLMFRSFQALRAIDPGYDVEGLLTARITVPSPEIEGALETAGFFRQLGERLAAQPGVEAVGFIDTAPLTGGLSYYSIEVEDHPRGPDELPVFASNLQTEAGYIEAMGIDLLEGRTLQPGDGAEGGRAVMVSRSFAEHWWPGQSPIGRRLRLGFPEEDWYAIVGVVADAHYQDLQSEAEEAVYWPATVGPAAEPQPTRGMDVAIRTSVDPRALIPVLRREVAAMNARIPVSNPRPMDDVFAAAMARTSFTVAMLGAASGIALLLGLVGIYGVISYIVAQRTREIGVRMALGATAPTVRGMVVRQGALLAALGAGIGLIAALALSRLMSSLLFGVSALDPVTYVGVAATLVGVAMLASWIPARRAAAVDPATALRF